MSWNEVGKCFVKIRASQDELPPPSSATSQCVTIQKHPSGNPFKLLIRVPRFSIRINLSVYLSPSSDASSRIKAVSLTTEVLIPCITLTSSSPAEAKFILSSKLSAHWRLRVPLNNVSFEKKHYGDDEHLSSFSGGIDDDKGCNWVEEFQDFLRCMKKKGYNSGYNVFPLTLNIEKVVQASDSMYAQTVHLTQCYGRFFVGITSRTMIRGNYAAKTDCPICLEDLDSSESLSLSCDHWFHRLCIIRWLTRNPSCPLCRCKFED